VETQATMIAPATVTLVEGGDSDWYSLNIIYVLDGINLILQPALRIEITICFVVFKISFVTFLCTATISGKPCCTRACTMTCIRNLSLSSRAPCALS
jgi:hypothetical protein